MNAFTDDLNFWLALLLVALAVLVALLPTLIAIIRGAEEISLILLFNVIGCVTFLGWPVALMLAIRAPRRRDLLSSLPPPPPPPGR
ncbi:hypothetical protein GCM10009678_66500 [Actinomadura kijaniata]|uniref:Superinfection immunity protein n=1 Tax=Actinomadura namibiensis TaxID=182080 RepID=A0A7W3LYH1_ACTNM|nr:superinfection immunity protein [Actinomadura namibiensis]MBA8956552.1 hypothetical protein [Actinomadura namibiensis]